MKKVGLNKLYFKDTSFANLMTERVHNVLLIASKYDAFMLEEDGRIDELLFNEYTKLNLTSPPRFTLASTKQEASEYLATRVFEIVIVMPAVESSFVFEYTKQIKTNHPNIQTVLLTPFSNALFKRVYGNEDMTGIDYCFSWLGQSDLLLAIVKLIEDKMNVDKDIQSVGVQAILFVEDSIRFYSDILPLLYKHVFIQSRSFMTEALNDHEQMLRMRGRPKILLARNYEEAQELYDKHKKNILGVISDVRYPKGGKEYAKAGVDLSTYIRKDNKFIPIILESAEVENKKYEDELDVVFIDKNSLSMQHQLKDVLTKMFGFGAFRMINPETKELAYLIENLKELQSKIFDIPADILYYHISRNHLSKWLYSRAMFPLAEFLRKLEIDSIDDIDMARQLIFDAIVSYRRIKNKGVVAVFSSDRYDSYSNFARIGSGSMGGKGRGLVFLDLISKRNMEFYEHENTQVIIPKTVVICSDKFDEFMEQNNLFDKALSDEYTDEEILEIFLKARLPRNVIKDLIAYIDVVQGPVAVRSSSLLEDAHYQPFAGVYSTYMVPHKVNGKLTALTMLCEAIKAVYASVYYSSSKSYMTATKSVLSSEKMAVVLQEVCGKAHGDRFYPSFSGVARSLNFYPIGDEEPEDGVVNLALGLGKYIVDGGLSLRFSPMHPNKVLQTSSLDLALSETQTYFNALDISKVSFKPQVDDGYNLLKISVRDAEPDGTLKYIASTFDPYDQIIRDGIFEGGRKVITFANILQHDVYPLADILNKVLKVGEKEMGRPVEIEFAVNLDYENNANNSFYLLQIRPTVDANKSINEDLDLIEDSDCLIRTDNALGNGIINDIYDIVYVKKGAFNPSNNQLIAYDIDKFNKRLTAEQKPYVLIGPGRWGSSDTWLGIPVKWPHIAGAKVIVEAGETSYHIDPSQGTHFFQNLTSCGSVYMTVENFTEGAFCDFDFLEQQELIDETKYIKHIRLTTSLTAKVDGKKRKGVLVKEK